MANRKHRTEYRLHPQFPQNIGLRPRYCFKFDLLLALIYKIEAVSDWMQSSPRFLKIFNHAINILFTAAIIWGTFFVPSDILLKSSTARSWVDVATTLFPWIAKLEVNWGGAAQKQVYLQSVFILVGAIPLGLSLLSVWTVRVGHRKFLKKLDTKIWGGLGSILFLIVIVLNDMESVDHGIHQQKTFRLFMLNPYFSAMGAVMCAAGAIIPLTIVPLSLLYLIHYLHLKIKQLLGQYHG